MDSEDPLDWLPSGWTFQIKKINDRKVTCYLDPEGQKFYSKQHVTEYLESTKNNPPSESRHNVDGPAGDISLEPDVFCEDEVLDSLPQEWIEGQTPESNRKHKRNGDQMMGEKSASQPDLSEGNITSGSIPEGWIVQLNTKENGRKFKCYVEPETGRKFYSKPEIYRYLKTQGSSKASENVEAVGSLAGDVISPEPLSSQKPETPEWLPDGWTVEIMSRPRGSGRMSVKCYKDPVSGKKFYSKPQVLNHLGLGNSSVEARQQRGGESASEPIMSPSPEATFVGRSISKMMNKHIQNSVDDEVVSRTPAVGLPQGWIKEMRMRKHSAVQRQDPYYVDPSSDFMFRSKLDALRYLETGDIKKCAMKPRIKDIHEKDSHNDHLTGENWATPTSQPKIRSRTRTLESLPPGWIVEEKRKSTGAKYKVYTNPENGQKFHSFPEISRYLKSIGSSMPSDNTQNDDQQTREQWASPPVRSRGRKNDDPLPDGWVVETRTKATGTKYKLYIEPGSGRKFQSKPQVFRYLESGDSGKARDKTENIGSVSVDGSSAKANETSDWLPDGWTVEVKTGKKNGLKHKCYTDPVSGRKFYSRLQVLNYLATKYGNDPGNVSGNASSNHRRIEEFDSREVVSRAPADGLPQGWIKELRTRKHGAQKDPYYIDPQSSYIFRSKKDALRYLETGSIETCVMKPMKRDANGTYTSAGAADDQQPENDTAMRQLFEEPENHFEAQDNNTDPTNAVDAPQIPPKTKLTPKRRTTANSTNNPSPTLPGRSSKRLKGVEPEIKTNPPRSTRATRSASRGPPESHPEDAQIEIERNDDGKNHVENEANDDLGESDMAYWTDPCLDFAVKTLQGEMLGGSQSEQETADFEAAKTDGPTKMNPENGGPVKVN